MGAWGQGHFENDDAMDWVWTLAHDTDGSALRSALGPAARRAETHEPPDVQASHALAAAAVVARARGTSEEALPEEAEAWLASYGQVVDDDLVEMSRAAVSRVHDAIRDEPGNEEWTVIVERL